VRTSDFERLKVFAAVAERGSFVKAAGALGVSTSSVSQSIRALEDRLGLRLLNRTTRSVALTEAGSHLLARVQPALIDLDDAFADLNAFRAEPTGSLKLSVSNLSLSNPGITVELAVTDRADLDASLDAGIRSKAVIPQDMIALRASEPSRFLVLASPDYIAARGAPERTADLCAHNCIQFRMKSGGFYPWAFLDGERRVEIATSGSLVTDNGHLTLKAAADGVGVCYAIESHARVYIDSGRLVPLLKAQACAFPGFFLYYPSRRLMPAPLKLFADFLTADAARRAQPRALERRSA
jgi:DNA-binding transcriptional LysR family regulator